MRKNLFLYLAIVCFVALIAIFVVDGYLGIYDTLRVTAGEYPQTIEPDQWHRYRPSPETTWGAKVFFTYDVENRQFSRHITPIYASVWQENERIFDLFSEEKSIKPFDQVTVDWVLDSERLKSLGFSEGQYTVRINRDGVERKVRVDLHIPNPAKLIPPPPRPAGQ